MKKIFASSLALIGVVTLLGAGCMSQERYENPPVVSSSNPSTGSSTDTTSSLPTTPYNTSYTNKAKTFSVEYPTSFTVKEAETAGEVKGIMVVELTSPWYIEEPSPATGETVRIPFTVSLEERPVTLDVAVDHAYPQYVKDYQAMKSGKSSQVDPNTIGVASIGGSRGYYFNSGAEGNNLRQVFVQKNASTTIVATIHYIGDASTSRMKPSVLSQKEQLDRAQVILDSVKFLK